MSQIGKERLSTMRQTNDGFEIAEADLRLRGGGDILGTRQSGLPGFRLADFVSYPDKMSELLKLANQETNKIIKENPRLEGERGFAIRLLLKIFSKDDAIRYTRS
jgi:ATP-dependent DNA helicase RecG